MNILFVHNNFPAQFRHVAQALARSPAHKVVAVGSRTARPVEGVDLVRYSLDNVDVSSTHPFARRFDMECRRAEQVLYGLSSLVASGFAPDLIVAHPGWGEMLPLRTMFPRTRIVAYCEFFYAVEGRDVGFDPEFPSTGLDGHISLHLKNASTMFALFDCDQGLSPTHWQRSTYPEQIQPKISVIHDGIDTDVAKPSRTASIRLRSGLQLTAEDEVVTFVARNLEPLRGYHTFMRAVPAILAARPRAHVVIVGGDGTSYGSHAPRGTTWKSIYFNEVAHRIDHNRVHFTGTLDYAQYLRILQISSAHVYLTYPFVLSWSLLEAMSTGCVVIGSQTAPVTEVLNENNGLLVPFFDVAALSDTVTSALRNRSRMETLRREARNMVVERFDLRRVCLPQLTAFLEGVHTRPQKARTRAVANAG